MDAGLVRHTALRTTRLGFQAYYGCRLSSEGIRAPRKDCCVLSLVCILVAQELARKRAIRISLHPGPNLALCAFLKEDTTPLGHENEKKRRELHGLRR